MTPQDPNDIPAPVDPDDPEAVMRDARQRFIAAFPKRSDSIGMMLAVVSSIGPRGPLTPLRQIVHRTAGLAGTLGFPNVSIKARALEELLEGVEKGTFDPKQGSLLFEAFGEAFTADLAKTPAWAIVEAGAGGNRRVMVVEDDEDQREVVSINLRHAGYAAIPVVAGDRAIAVARVERPDLILLDANLPGMDGYTVCRLLKTDPDLAGIPVIFMTVRASLDDRMAGLMLGADDYLIKPLDMQELMLRIQILLGRQTRNAEVRRAPAAAAPAANLHELDYESFVAVAREQLAILPAALALVRVPEARLRDSFTALGADARRRDLVACYDPSHIILLLVEMSAAKARERLSEIIKRLGPGDPPRFHIGIAASAVAGGKTFETLIGESDQAIALARQRGALAVVAGEKEPAAQAATPRRGTIVLADDDPDVTRLIDAHLRPAGYKTVIVSDGSQALAAVEAHRPDLLVLDMVMPGMSGFNVLTALRNRPTRPRVIVLSTRGLEEDVTRAFVLGADDYVMKPFRPSDLLARVDKALR